MFTLTAHTKRNYLLEEKFLGKMNSSPCPFRQCLLSDTSGGNNSLLVTVSPGAWDRIMTGIRMDWSQMANSFDLPTAAGIS